MKKSAVLMVFLSFAFLAPSSGAAPGPVDPIELDTGASVGEAVSNVSPAGRQVITYKRDIPGGSATKLVERTNGKDFSAPVQLTDTTNAEEPEISFTPAGGVYAIWGVASSGAKAQQTYRSPGGDFTPAATVDNCGRFTDSAAGPDGQIAVACSRVTATTPPNSYGFSRVDALGPLTVSDSIIAPVYDNFIQPEIDWGADGTIVITGRFRNTTTNPPPANETTLVRYDIRNTANTLVSAGVISFATEPNEIFTGGTAVLDDGTIAVAVGGNAGARAFIRPPGAASAFTPQDLGAEAARGIQADDAQNLHVAIQNQGPPRVQWSRVRPPGGSFGTPVPIPLAGAGDPYLVDFDVAGDGTEYVIIRADDGTWVTSHSPGEVSFTTPKKIGGVTEGSPTGAVTPDNDLLISWVETPAPGDQRLYAGGFDSGKPPAVTVGSFPTKLHPGTEGSFSATAIDSMGVRATGWDFGDGTTALGDDATHTFPEAGRYEVKYIATDRAGNQAVESRTVQVGDVQAAGPSLKLKLPKTLNFRTLAKKGVRITAIASPAMKVTARIAASKKALRRKPLATRNVKKPKERQVLRLKPKRGRLGKARAFRLRVRVTATTAAGKVLSRSGSVKIRK